jgi:hypothetical protein
MSEQLKNELEQLQKRLNEARHVAELLWREVNYMGRRYVGLGAPKPPSLPWAYLANADRCADYGTADNHRIDPISNEPIDREHIAKLKASLDYHIRWRRGADIEMPNPTKLGFLLDEISLVLSKISAETPE